MAEKIASYSEPVTSMAKECVNRAYESSTLSLQKTKMYKSKAMIHLKIWILFLAICQGLAEGVLFERRVFHATWGLDDRKEGMSAFAEKRDPNFTNE